MAAIGTMAAVALAALALTTVWAMLWYRGASVWRWCSAALLPFSQLVIVAFLFHVVAVARLDAWSGVLTMCAGFACVAGDVVLFRAVRASEEKGLAEARIRMFEEQMEANRAYRERLEQEANEAEAIREKLETLLDAVDERIAAGDIEGMEACIDQAVGLMRPSSVTYCRNHAVDALVSSKIKELNQAGVDVSCSLDVPSDLPFSAVDVNALFANLLDNALQASSLVPQGEKRVRVVACAIGGLFVIDVQNPCTAGVEAVDRNGEDVSLRGVGLAEHGWGLRILDDIVERYDGTAEIGRNGSVFRATIMLPLHCTKGLTKDQGLQSDDGVAVS